MTGTSICQGLKHPDVSLWEREIKQIWITVCPKCGIHDTWSRKLEKCTNLYLETFKLEIIEGSQRLPCSLSCKTLKGLTVTTQWFAYIN